METVVLGVAAFLTAILSAVLGLAGGITLLAVMLLFLDPLVAIPLHGAVQLVANGSRVWFQRRHVERGIAARFALLLLPAGFAGLALARELPAEGLRVAIGLFVLIATWFPRWLTLGVHPGRVAPGPRFVALGGVAGILNVTIGATGPLIAPFFLDLGLSRFALVGTQAACAVLGHAAKLVVFGVAGFAFSEHLVLWIVLAAMVVAGTAVGTRLLERVDERRFVILYKGVLTAIALHLLVRAALAAAR